MKIELKDADFHPHILQRMQQRGVSKREVEVTLNEGWTAEDATVGTQGRVFVFAYDAIWEGTHYGEKEVTVYSKYVGGKLVLLTAKARYGSSFERRTK